MFGNVLNYLFFFLNMFPLVQHCLGSGIIVILHLQARRVAIVFTPHSSWSNLCTPLVELPININRMDNLPPLPPIFQKWSQNILHSGAAIFGHLEPESATEIKEEVGSLVFDVDVCAVSPVLQHYILHLTTTTHTHAAPQAWSIHQYFYSVSDSQSFF